MANEEKILEMLATINNRIENIEKIQTQMQVEISRLRTHQSVNTSVGMQHLSGGHQGIIEALKEIKELKKIAEDTECIAEAIFMS